MRKKITKAQEAHVQHFDEPGVTDPEPILQKELDPVTERMKGERAESKNIAGLPLDNKGRPLRF
ncbi:MAG: hypothetical protein JWM99_184 [Verrucomicrobiales bacterium]|nr:hypothetical protein [Verrucomicrobiales bacterium]